MELTPEDSRARWFRMRAWTEQLPHMFRVLLFGIADCCCSSQHQVRAHIMDAVARCEEGATCTDRFETAKWGKNDKPDGTGHEARAAGNNHQLCIKQGQEVFAQRLHRISRESHPNMPSICILDIDRNPSYMIVVCGGRFPRN